MFLGIYALAALAALGFVRVLMCPPGGSKPIIRTLAVIIGLAGSTTVFVAMYALYLDEQVVEEFVGTTTIYSVICTGALLAIVSLLVIVGMIRRSTILLLVVFLVLSLIFLLEATASFLVVFWIVQLNSVANDSIETLDGSGRWDGYVGEEVLAEVEGFVCRTYQLCCRDPALDLIDVDYASGWFEPGSGRSQATCFTPPEGTTNDISASLNDPSSLNFCRCALSHEPVLHSHAAEGRQATSAPRQVCFWVEFNRRAGQRRVRLAASREPASTLHGPLLSGPDR